jgi:MFS superfamily sulfate permease-like transporter
MTAAKASRPRLPILEGILPFDSSRLPNELIAGATLAALAIPETMGYATMAGMPVVTGLYTLLIPILLFALLGSSRHLVVGADSATAVVLASGLASLGLATGSTEYVAMAGFAALMVAVVLLAARLLRLGFIANFLSRSVLIGFLTGVGIQVAMGQLHGVLGVSDGTGNTLEKFWTTLTNIGQTNVPTLLLSIAVWVVILGSERINKKIPGALIAVAGSIAIAALGLLPASVTLLGPVPGGLPPVGLPQGVLTTDNAIALAPIVFSCFIIILAQSAATSRAYAVKYSDSFNENVDLIGLSAANLGAGLSGTFVVNGSPTKTEMVDGAGGRSQIAQLTAGVLVLVVLLFLTGLLADLPNAVLAAVVLLIGVKLVDVKGMRDIARVRGGEFAVAAITAATVVVVGVEQAILLAIVLSVIEHLYHAYRPYDTTLAVGDDRVTATPMDTGVVQEAAPGLVIYSFGASIYYANATRFTEQAMLILETADPPVEWFCLSGAAIRDIDYTGAGAVAQVIAQVKERGAKFVVTDLAPNLLARAGLYGIQEQVDHQFDSVKDVVAAFKARQPA